MRIMQYNKKVVAIPSFLKKHGLVFFSWLSHNSVAALGYMPRVLFGIIMERYKELLCQTEIQFKKTLLEY